MNLLCRARSLHAVWLFETGLRAPNDSSVVYFHKSQVRWKHYTRQRARSARREPRPKLGGDAGRRCRVPVELSDAAGKASFPPGTFKGSATSHKFASQNASGHQTSGASTTPVFRCVSFLERGRVWGLGFGGYGFGAKVWCRGSEAPAW